ncbi:MAG TPA: PEP-CTERM sorting domain-containing protein [Pirellulales bacterium]
MVHNWRTTGLAMFCALAMTLPATAEVISLNFSSGYDNNGPPPTTSLPAADVAGVVRAANWNNLAGATGSASGLLNSNGNATGEGVTWSSNGTWSTGTALTNGDYTMMYSGFDERLSNTASVAVSGLGHFTSYSVYAYFAADATSSVVEGYTIGSQSYWGSFLNGAGAKFAGTYIQATGTTQAAPTAGANYAMFTGLTGSSFTLTATPGANWRAELMGIQIVGVPEPASWALMLGAAIGLGAVVRRRKSSSRT